MAAKVSGQARNERRHGKISPEPQPPVFLLCQRRGKTGKREVFIIGWLPRAALRLPGAIIISSLQGLLLGSQQEQQGCHWVQMLSWSFFVLIVHVTFFSAI